MRTRGLVWALMLGLGVLSGPVLGQDEPTRGSSPTAKGPTPQPKPAIEAEFTMSVDYPGGTVGQYIDALKKAAGKNAVNVVASRQAMEVPVAPISLRDVSLFAALSAVQGAAGRDTQWNVRPLGLMGSKNAEAWSLEMQPSPGSMVTMGPAGPQQRSQPEGGIRVFSLRDLTEPLPGDPPGVALTKSPEVVLTAVRASLDLAGDRGGEAAEMKFHEDSGLLIVHGNNEQVGAVMQTLDQMRDDVRRRREAARQQPGRPGADEIRAQVQKGQVVLNQAKRDFDRASKALELGKARVDAGQASFGELTELEAKRDEAESRLQMASIDLDQLQSLLKAAEAGQRSQPGASLDDRMDQARLRLSGLNEELSRAAQQLDQARKSGKADEVKALETRVAQLTAAKDQTAAELTRMTRDAAKAGDAAAPGGKSVAIYDIADMGAKAREQLISSIRALETAINNPEKLKIQSVQGESKLVIEADGAMHAVVRGMCKEVMGARGEPGKADDKLKPRGR